MASVVPDTKAKHVNADFTRRLEGDRLVPLWNFFNDWFTPGPRISAEPYLWHYDGVRPALLEAADIISAKEAERRVLVLDNPGLAGRYLVTDTLYAGLQLVMPGEIAPAHRHTPVALRLVIESDGGYTSVAGERTWMAPGDFVVTPSWVWHDHGNEGTEPVIWLDVLDVPLIRFLGANFTEHYPEERYPEERPVNDSLYRYGMNMRPVDYSGEHLASPVFSYPYSRTREALERLKGHSEWDPCHGLKMEYVDPVTGGSAIPTISTFMQLVPGGFETDTYRSTDGAVFCVIEGRGTVKIGTGDDERTFDFRPRDIFAVPCWSPYSIKASEETVIFSASDRVVQTKLNVWREQR